MKLPKETRARLERLGKLAQAPGAVKRALEYVYYSEAHGYCVASDGLQLLAVKWRPEGGVGGCYYAKDFPKVILRIEDDKSKAAAARLSKWRELIPQWKAGDWCVRRAWVPKLTASKQHKTHTLQCDITGAPKPLLFKYPAIGAVAAGEQCFMVARDKDPVLVIDPNDLCSKEPAWLGLVYEHEWQAGAFGNTTITAGGKNAGKLSAAWVEAFKAPLTDADLKRPCVAGNIPAPLEGEAPFSTATPDVAPPIDQRKADLAAAAEQKARADKVMEAINSTCPKWRAERAERAKPAKLESLKVATPAPALKVKKVKAPPVVDVPKIVKAPELRPEAPVVSLRVVRQEKAAAKGKANGAPELTCENCGHVVADEQSWNVAVDMPVCYDYPFGTHDSGINVCPECEEFQSHGVLKRYVKVEDGRIKVDLPLGVLEHLLDTMAMPPIGQFNLGYAVINAARNEISEGMDLKQARRIFPLDLMPEGVLKRIAKQRQAKLNKGGQ